MGSKIRLEHNGDGYRELFTSPAVQAVVDAAGERIAEEAGPHFGYQRAKRSNFAAGGFVSSDAYSGAYYEATDKRLSKAVHR